MPGKATTLMSSGVSEIDFFPTDLLDIKARVQSIRPENYARNRNYLDGSVTKLSPYISRGVISTRTVYQSVLERGYEPRRIEKFIQELAWRDYWQLLWEEHGRAISNDLRSTQQRVRSNQMPRSILSAKTGIRAIDQGIQALYSTGYMHNHMRMYVAAIACNIAQCHWLTPARWMYYHLLDADWASNALSWQWVAGTNSNKKYIANQANINKYTHSDQKGTFLDINYEELASRAVPDCLEETCLPGLELVLPLMTDIKLNSELPVCLYNFYNLDPQWRRDIAANRVLLLEPSHFSEFPVSTDTFEFIIQLSKNIPEVKIFVGEFAQLKELAGEREIYFKSHPLNRHYQGIEDEREWLTEIRGVFPSFFAYWKHARKQLL